MLRLAACLVLLVVGQAAFAENLYSRFAYSLHQLDDSRFKTARGIEFGLGYSFSSKWQIELNHFNTGDLEVKSNLNSLHINSTQFWLGYNQALPWHGLQLQSQLGLHSSRLDSPQASKSRSEYGLAGYLGLAKALEPNLKVGAGLKVLDNIDKNNQLLSLSASLRFHF